MINSLTWASTVGYVTRPAASIASQVPVTEKVKTVWRGCRINSAGISVNTCFQVIPAMFPSVVRATELGSGSMYSTT